MRHNSEFLFGIYWWIWKNNYLLKKLLKWTKKIKKSTWRYYYFTPVYQKPWWYDLQFLRYWVWMTEIGNYGLFFAIHRKNPPWKIRILRKWENLTEISFYTCVLKTTIIRDTGLEIWSETDRIFCYFEPFFALLPHYWPRKLKLAKKQQQLEISSFYTCVL